METWFPMDKPKAMEEKYQDVGQEKVVVNGGYVTQRPLQKKCSS
jgi:hypothetical protein